MMAHLPCLLIGRWPWPCQATAAPTATGHGSYDSSRDGGDWARGHLTCLGTRHDAESGMGGGTRDLSDVQDKANLQEGLARDRLLRGLWSHELEERACSSTCADHH